jgi:hypothetical protein
VNIKLWRREKLRLDLPSGGWIEYRDQLRGKDKFAVQGAIRFTMEEGRAQEVTGAVSNNMRNALLARIITDWSFPEPIPAKRSDLDLSDPLQLEDAIGEPLDIDDYNALQEAVEPLFEKVSFQGPNRKTSSG